ncbi:hypothetical protein [Desertivirga xinjiangensis]|uniref:hypothetical protein n=1 Tax=Desertivirga xinjiangensis TaxID=539206 RepID=UPI00210A661E|nr:hypothetical protein [Pedobacter xinjiangensis]
MKAKTAIKILLIILVLVIIFHSLILGGAIPYKITWGGRLKTEEEMYVFESISILINLFLALILVAKGQFSRLKLPLKFTTITLWFFFVVFVLNTIGNLFAETNFEKCFSILTLIFSVLILVILREKEDKT